MWRDLTLMRNDLFKCYPVSLLNACYPQAPITSGGGQIEGIKKRNKHAWNLGPSKRALIIKISLNLSEVKLCTKHNTRTKNNTVMCIANITYIWRLVLVRQFFNVSFSSYRRKIQNLHGLNPIFILRKVGNTSCVVWLDWFAQSELIINHIINFFFFAFRRVTLLLSRIVIL